MSASNRRNKCVDTIHHLMSRIAHKVYFLGEEERNDFLKIMKRSAYFCGIRLYGWCVMTNHFHILAYLPVPRDLDEAEVLARYEVLKGRIARMEIENQLAEWRSQGETGERIVKAWLDGQCRRMYDIGEYMRIVKQWVTQDYNKRHGHVGTLWESTYKDKVVKSFPGDVSSALSYIHLNPIRAAICKGFSEYRWSSFYSFSHGESSAAEGLRFIYGMEMSNKEMRKKHVANLGRLLTEEQLQRAKAIVRKKANGIEVTSDPLTSEAKLAQSAIHVARVQQALIEMHAECEATNERKKRNELLDDQIIANLDIQPDMPAAVLASLLNVSVRNVYRRLRHLKQTGKLRTPYCAPDYKCQKRSDLV